MWISSLLKQNAEGLIVFTGTCYERGVVGHTGAIHGIPVSDAMSRAPLAEYGGAKLKYARKQIYIYIYIYLK